MVSFNTLSVPSARFLGSLVADEHIDKLLPLGAPVDLSVNHSPIALLQLNHRVLAVIGGPGGRGAKTQVQLVKMVVSTFPRVKRQCAGGGQE